MNTYVVLLRGINVGGKNTIPMSRLKECLEDLGYSSVSSYIASGNLVLKSHQSANQIRSRIEKALPKRFKLDNEVIKVLVLNPSQLRAVIDNKPKGFGEQPDKYHSDAIFLMGIDSTQAMSLFNPREGVDKVWPGDGVIYSQRLSSLRTKSRLNRVLGTPEYKFMTIRSWNTTTRLNELAGRVGAGTKKDPPAQPGASPEVAGDASRSKRPKRRTSGA
jgi:uncharacterized protein (DUF1697 family)